MSGFNFTEGVENTHPPPPVLYQEKKAQCFRVNMMHFFSAILNYGMESKASSDFQKTTMKKVDSEYFANTGNNDTCIVFQEQLMSIDTIRTKEFYDLLISKIFKQPSCQKTIGRMLNVGISDWKEIYTLSRKITPDSYSRIFQYKILNNILYLNKHLHQFKIVSISEQKKQ